ncbi:MAG: hypothetical protein GXO12_05440 [Epsilonproteobacteria bacterium]|nr:hypothetical protein [Campylobacterota bacterium]
MKKFLLLLFLLANLFGASTYGKVSGCMLLYYYDYNGLYALLNLRNVSKLEMNDKDGYLTFYYNGGSSYIQVNKDEKDKIIKAFIFCNNK